MKSIQYTYLTFFLALLLSVGTLFGQAPEGINYQAVVRDNAGMHLANQAVSFQLSILQGSATGTPVYVETQAGTTSDIGLIDFEIGQGTVVSGSFNTIDWGTASYFLQVELDPNGGSAFTSMGTSKLVSVPYALYAKNVENDQVNDADADSTNEFNTSAVLNGTDLEITDGGGTLTTDLSSLQDGVMDADADPMNEYNSDFSLTGNDLSLTDGGGTYTVNLAAFADADGDSTNELQTLSLSGSDLTLSDGGGTVSINDADADTANELQTLSLTGDDLTLSNGGGTIDLSSYNDSPWDQSGNEIFNTNTGNVGIGTNTPSNPFHLVGAGNLVRLENSTSNKSIYILPPTSNATGGIGLDTADDLPLFTDGSDRLTVKGNGDIDIDNQSVFYQESTKQLGVGTATPSAYLDVSPSLTSTGGAIFRAFSPAASAYETTDVAVIQSGPTGTGVTGTVLTVQARRGDDAAYNLLEVNNNLTGSASSKMVVTGEGNVGIGESAPAEKLHVEGNMDMHDDSLMLHMSLDNEEDAMIKFSDDDAPTTQAFEIAWNAGDQDLHFRSDDNSYADIMTMTQNGFIYASQEIRLQNFAGGERVRIGDNGISGAGSIEVYGPNGNWNFVTVPSSGGGANSGALAVCDTNGATQALLFVDAAGDGIVSADVKNFRMPHPSQPGKEIWYASLEGPEAGAYERGTARLVNGTANITFSDHFQEVLSETGMTVILTPLSASSKGMAVVEKRADGFQVAELMNGTGNYEFDWEVKVVRKGYENYRVIRDASETELKTFEDPEEVESKK